MLADNYWGVNGGWVVSYLYGSTAGDPLTGAAKDTLFKSEQWELTVISSPSDFIGFAV